MDKRLKEQKSKDSSKGSTSWLWLQLPPGMRDEIAWLILHVWVTCKVVSSIFIAMDTADRNAIKDGGG